jgi:hypothetical protein
MWKAIKDFEFDNIWSLLSILASLIVELFTQCDPGGFFDVAYFIH